MMVGTRRQSIKTPLDREKEIRRHGNSGYQILVDQCLVLQLRHCAAVNGCRHPISAVEA
ncbi:hypothetical protein HPP92_025664 [Vanilla planifolia]|uniref:Uncharacterized protein n=1 Tax=Vanilla planifolia TaxID=51239 RepID=A0A835UAU1_VANPL|nr:hypothetical protein HPP92_025664 [Vanilla planifolia]